MFCSNCGNKLYGNECFCSKCGCAINLSVVPPASNGTYRAKVKNRNTALIVLALVVLIVAVPILMNLSNSTTPEKVVEKYLSYFQSKDYHSAFQLFGGDILDEFLYEFGSVENAINALTSEFDYIDFLLEKEYGQNWRNRMEIMTVKQSERLALIEARLDWSTFQTFELMKIGSEWKIVEIY